jgi:hypothetical protein
MYSLYMCGLFSNSFVVGESSLLAFCVATSALLHAFNVLAKSGPETRRSLHFVLTLFFLGLLR